MIKAITFDLDGVYFVNGKSHFIENIVKLGVAEVEAKRVFLESDEMNINYKEGKWTDNDYWSWAADQWKVNKTPQELIKILIDGYEVDPDVVEAIIKVRSMGLKTLICSNNFPARINGLNERFKFLENFDSWTLSYEVGYTKPSSKIFLELIKKSGVLPEEILYSDDSEDKIAGARRVGIQVFLYTNFAQFKDNLRGLGIVL